MKNSLNILLYFLISSLFLFAQSDPMKSIEIETFDGNILLGDLIEENEDSYLLKTKDGIEINVPKSSVKNIRYIETSEIRGQVLRADPNKSMYLFAPSAYPIENEKAYCRDFCLFFPSYNRGFGNKISIQAGAFIVPGMDFQYVPLVLSAKYSLPKKGFARFATGIMYISVPFSDGEGNFGAGFTFGTATFGNLFNHFSTSIGFGYARDGNDWDFAEEPILVLAGNSRISSDFSMVAESWLFPEAESVPIMVSGRFIGRKIAVDLGFILSTDMEGIPFPLINFTYHIE